MAKNTIWLTPEESRRLRRLIEQHSGSTTEFAKKTYRLENPERVEKLDPEAVESVRQRFEKVLTGRGGLTAKTANSIAQILQKDYDGLLREIRCQPPSAQLHRQQVFPSDYPWPKLKQALARSYLRRLSEACRSVRFPGMPPGRSLELADIFAELHTREPQSDELASQGGAGEHAQRLSRALPGTASSGETRVPVFQALAGHPRLVLLGTAGSGKTTCLRYLACVLADNFRASKSATARQRRRQNLPKSLFGWVPVWVELKRLLQQDLPQLGRVKHTGGGQQSPDEHWLWNRLLSLLTPAEGYAPEDAALLLQARNEGRCWFFFDGLDEITNQDQAMLLRKQIKVFTDQWAPMPPPNLPEKARASGRGNRVTITCRESTWHRGWELHGWDAQSVRTIDRLSDDEQQALVAKLFAAPGFLPTGIARDKVKADKGRAALKDALADPSRNRMGRLQEMAGVPLTLTMLAWLAGHTHALPRTRAALYEQVIHALLWSLDEEKGLPGQSLARLLEEKTVDRERFTAALCRVAFNKQRESPFGGEPILSLADLQNPIARLALPPGEQIPGEEEEGWAIKVIRTVQLRAGVVREEGTDVKNSNSFRFMHRSFQEFLAAVHLARQGDLEQQAVDWARQDAGFPRIPFANGPDEEAEKEERETATSQIRTYLGFIAKIHPLRQSKPDDWNTQLTKLDERITSRLAALLSRGLFKNRRLAAFKRSQEFIGALHRARQGRLSESLIARLAARVTYARRLKDPAVAWLQRLAAREKLWEPLRLCCGYLVAPYLLKDELTLQDDLTLKPGKDGPFLFPCDMRAGSNRRTPRAAFALLNRLSQVGQVARHVNWHDVWLAAELLEELEPDAHPHMQTHDWTKLKRNVRARLVKLVRAGALTPPERAEAGSSLGRLRDPRPGVGLRPDGLPDIQFVPAGVAGPLPAGEFTLGEIGTRVMIKHDYRISRYPITVAQYQAFVKAGGYDERNADASGRWSKVGWHWKVQRGITGPEDFGPFFRTPNHPCVGVNWYEAAAFCDWLTEKLRAKGELAKDQLIRLPHEVEWELAARWRGRQSDNRTYPWGECGENEIAQHCNCRRTGIRHTTSVGLFPRGNADCGAADMAGNVWEWCENWYDEKEKTQCVVRGGCWTDLDPDRLRLSYRVGFPPVDRDCNFGFRCVLVWVGSASG